MEQEPEQGLSTNGRALTDYLALPLDQYALLDPKWISRPDPENNPDVFVLKVSSVQHSSSSAHWVVGPSLAEGSTGLTDLLCKPAPMLHWP